MGSLEDIKGHQPIRVGLTPREAKKTGEVLKALAALQVEVIGSSTMEAIANGEGEQEVDQEGHPPAPILTSQNLGEAQGPQGLVGMVMEARMEDGVAQPPPPAPDIQLDHVAHGTRLIHFLTGQNGTFGLPTNISSMDLSMIILMKGGL